MKSFRRQRAESQLRKELTEILRFAVDAAELPSVYISNVALSPDLSVARVYVTPAIPGEKAEEEELVRPLRRRATEIRRLLTQRIQMRRIPELDFRLDRAQQNADRIETLLDRIKKRGGSGAAIVALACWLGTAWAQADTPLERYEANAEAMGATFQIALYGERRGALASAAVAAFEEARRIDALISNYRDDSEWSLLNREAAERAVPASQESLELLAACLGYSRASEGAFDVTVGPLIKVWGFFRGTGELPGPSAVEAALDQVGYRYLELDARALTVRFRRDLELDPGGIGKGYAVERIVRLLRRYGVRSAYVSAGSSSIYAIGHPPGEPRGWRTLIRDPRDPKKTAAEIFLKDQSLSTSGSYEKVFEVDGAVYSHIVDPRTGWPAKGALSVSVVSPSPLDSEAWTTAYFVNGLEWTSRHARPDFDVFFCPAGETCRWIPKGE